MDHTGWDARYAASDLVWGGEPNRFVVEEFTGVPPGRAVDLAAGEGRNAIWLAGLGWSVSAVDFSRVAIERGRQLAAARGLIVEFLVADVLEYQPERAAYDAVLIAYLHLPPPHRRQVLAGAVAALAPGGRILVVGHDRTNLTDGTGGPRDPDILYTPDEIVADLPGLSVRRAQPARRPVVTDDGVVDAIDTVVLAVRPGPT
jgi:2-polyprenyl-3-methyl-5-hydroxy-6-metoxy-1,4-benzoquinol methylase